MSAGDTNLPHGAYHAPWFNGCGGSNETNNDMIDIAELGLSKKEFVAVGCAATTRAGARRRPYRGILQHSVKKNRARNKYRTLAQ